MQNQSLSSEICSGSSHEIGRSLPIVFQRNWPRKFPRNSREIGRFFREFAPENPAKFDFFSRDLPEALIIHVLCFYGVIETWVEVWENKKCCGNTSRRQVFPQLFQVLPNFHECCYNSIETWGTCFVFLLENNTRNKRNTTCLLWSSKWNFSLLMPSLHKQLGLVLCFYQVMETRFLTNQRAYFLGAVF